MASFVCRMDTKNIAKDETAILNDPIKVDYYTG